jgi:hypothetical protein
MGTRSPEGGNPFNIDPKTVRVAPEQRQFRRGLKKSEEPQQQSLSPNHELSEHYRQEQERHSGVLENPLRVPQPLPQNAGEQRGETQPSQPTPAEQQAAERLGKPPPQSGEQEIEALLPAYFDYDDRERVAMRFDPDTEPGDRLPEFHGWDNLAEVLLDFSGFLSKPEDPTIHPDDYEGKLKSYRVAMLLGARGWEKETVKKLEAQGGEDLIPQFRQDMQEYRKAAKGIIAVWRKRGLL